MSKEYFIPLQENNFYHIYNQGNNGDNIFYRPENYFYFLRKYDEYLSDFMETYAYCLLPNHFHILVKVKFYAVFPLQSSSKDKGTEHTPNQLISKQFRRFFLSYAQAVNKQENRRGSLFQKNFKRKAVSNSAYFKRLIHYIHSNPQRHGLIGDFREYPYSSYGRILIDKPTKLFKNEVLKWFGSPDDYKSFHAIKHDYNELKDLIIENE